MDSVEPGGARHAGRLHHGAVQIGFHAGHLQLRSLLQLPVQPRLPDLVLEVLLLLEDLTDQLVVTASLSWNFDVSSPIAKSPAGSQRTLSFRCHVLVANLAAPRLGCKFSTSLPHSPVGELRFRGCLTLVAVRFVTHSTS